MSKNKINKEILQEIKNIVDSWDFIILPKEYGPYTAQLINEDDPTGMVEFRDKNGIARMQMLREDYDFLNILKYGCKT